MDRISSINHDAGEDDEGLQVNTADMDGNTNPALVASNAEALVSGNSGPAAGCCLIEPDAGPPTPPPTQNLPPTTGADMYAMFDNDQNNVQYLVPSILLSISTHQTPLTCLDRMASKQTQANHCPKPGPEHHRRQRTRHSGGGPAERPRGLGDGSNLIYKETVNKFIY